MTSNTTKPTKSITPPDHTQTEDILSISLDVESVLAATHPYMLKQYNQRHDTTYTMEDVDSWDWVRTEIEWETFNEIVTEGWQSGEINPNEPNVGIAVQQLTLRDDIVVDVITGRTGVEEAMQAWLDDHNIPYNEFYAVDHTKATLGYDKYIDDKPGLAENLSSDKTQYTIKQPYNTHIQTNDNTIMVNTVNEAIGEILSTL